MKNDKVISILNELIEACRDGQEGFREAADYAESPDLKMFFRQESLERAQFVGDLQQQVQALGGDPEKSGSTGGAVHRAWMTIKGTLTGKDDKSILNEVERGEDSAVDAYEKSLREGLPANLKLIIEKQYLQIKTVHDRVKQMRDSRSVSAGRK